jgi:tetratricopeptide (TPR) repeat protein
VEGAFIASSRRGVSKGEYQQALRDMERATSIDPLNAWAFALRAWAHAAAGEHENAVSHARHSIELDPASFTGRWALVWALAATGADLEAIEAAEPALRMSGRSPRVLCEMAASHARLGNREAAELIHQEIAERARNTYIGWAEQASIAASAGRSSEALDLLRTAIKERDTYLSFNGTPAWGPLRGNEEGRRLLDSVGT